MSREEKKRGMESMENNENEEDRGSDVQEERNSKRERETWENKASIDKLM